jgi:hypothetical protein
MLQSVKRHDERVYAIGEILYVITGVDGAMWVKSIFYYSAEQFD